MGYANDRTMVNIGRLTSAVGLKGELKVMLYAEDSDNLHVNSKIFIDNRGREIEAEVTALRWQKNHPVIRITGVADRNAAEELRNSEIYIPEEDLAELGEGEYYIRDLIGLTVLDFTSGEPLGTVTDILDGSAQAVYVVKQQSGKDLLIPAVPAFEREIDLEKGTLTVELIPGFLD